MISDGFGHESPYEGKTDDWITPQWVISAFDGLAGDNFFNLDPCISLTQPWPTARMGYNIKQDGLKQPWSGRIWLNPPYGPYTEKWVRQLIGYGDGVALIFARIETRLWQDYIFPNASGLLFPKRRLAFARPDGTTPKSSSGAPSAFIAFGDECREALYQLAVSGQILGTYFNRPAVTVIPTQLSLL